MLASFYKDNLHDMLTMSIIFYDLYMFFNNVLSPSVKYLSDRKIACQMDAIDPSDHLTFGMLANPLASRLCLFVRP